MKILLATSLATPRAGGVASYNQELVRALCDNNVFYLLTDSDECNVKGFFETKSTFKKSAESFDDCREIVDWINSGQFDLVIDSFSSFIPYVCPFLNAPIVSISHFVNGQIAHKAGYNSLYKSSIIALSNYSKTFIEESFRINNKDKVKVVYNFVAPASKKIDKVNDDVMTFVYPGGSDVHKSFDVVLDAIYRLVRTDLNFRFIWLGGNTLPSANRSLLKKSKLTQLLPKDERVVYKGHIPREDAEEIIGSANVFVLPSRGEGCPMTLLEAMRIGCIPIVSDARHGSREIVEKCGGYIVKQGSGKELFNTIKAIIHNPAANVGYYAQTRAYSEIELGREKWVSSMIQIFNEAISSEKITIQLNQENFIKSCKGLDKFLRVDRMKVIFLSAVTRIKIDLMCLTWRIIGGKTIES